MTLNTAVLRKKRSLSSAILLLSLCLSAFAWGSNYAPILVEDLGKLDPSPCRFEKLSCGSTTENAVVYDGKLLFFSCDVDDTLALWCTTGTQLGTFKIMDLQKRQLQNAPAPRNPHCYFSPEPSTNGPVFLFYNACSQSVELWCTDGSKTGTQCIKTIENRELIAGAQYHLRSMVAEGVAFFWLQNDEGAEVWRTEGTVETTCCFAHINENGAISATNDPLASTLQPIKEAVHLENLLTRGTAETTFFVNGTCSFILPNGTVIGGNFDTEERDAHLLRLTKENRLEAYKTFHSSRALKFAQLPVRTQQDKRLPRSCRGPIYFLHWRDLWVTDGTDEGTQKEEGFCDAIPWDFSPFALIDEGTYIYALGQWKDGYFYTAVYNKTSKELVLQPEPVKADHLATENTHWFGVYAMPDGILLSYSPGNSAYLIQPGKTHSFLYEETAFTTDLYPMHGRWYMRYKEKIGNFEYLAWYCTDGTENGSFKAVDTCSTRDMEKLSNGGTQIIALDNRLVLKTPNQKTWFVSDESDGVQPLGYPLSDDFFYSLSTQNNFRLSGASDKLFAFDKDGQNKRMLLKPFSLLAQARLPHILLSTDSYCFCYEPDTGTVYRTDGTLQGTKALFQIKKHTDVDFVQMDDKMIFRNGNQLETMDLEGENRQLLYACPTGSEIADQLLCGTYCLWNQKLYFPVNTRSNKRVRTSTTALWVTDGTPSGTHKIAETPNIVAMIATPSQIIMKASYYTEGTGNYYGILRSDGTATGTHEVILPTLKYICTPLECLDDYVFFLAQDQFDDIQMWRTNGTAAGTFPVTDVNRGFCTDIRPFAAGSLSTFYDFYTAICKKRFYFQLPNYPALFETDGSVSGTRCVHRFWENTGQNVLTAHLYVYNDTLFYNDIDTQYNNTLWKLGPDSDGDGIADEMEGQSDLDGDGKLNSMDDDCDNDGILDAVEGFMDMDRDGIINALDLDSDGDGIPDSIEGTQDTNEDGVPDYLDTDSDYDGLSDAEEGIRDMDGDGIPDYRDPDCDGNGFGDRWEGREDIDGDGIPNFRDFDNNGNGILDSEDGNGDLDQDDIPDFMDNDIDGDGISNETEGDADPDNDGIPNYLDPDSDNDGISDQQEWQLGANPYDGVSNLPLSSWPLFIFFLFLVFILIPKKHFSD